MNRKTIATDFFEACKLIRDDPKHWAQGEWYEDYSTSSARRARRLYLENKYSCFKDYDGADSITEDFDCGTTMCLAGWMSHVTSELDLSESSFERVIEYVERLSSGDHPAQSTLDCFFTEYNNMGCTHDELLGFFVFVSHQTVERVEEILSDLIDIRMGDIRKGSEVSPLIWAHCLKLMAG